MDTLTLSDRTRRHGPFWLAGLALCLLYGWHVRVCADSAMFYFPYVYLNSDMHANLLWARSILDQGWLNPNPHHPYADWMRGVGTPAEWLKWWGGAAIFQQSPLYAYLLAGFLAVTDDLLYVLMLQALLAASLCGLLGLITARITGRRRDGWLAFGLAGLYAPFYAYSQVLVRDVLGWWITAALLLALLEFEARRDLPRHRRWLALGIGVLLGLGYLAREIYLLLAPLVLGVCAWRLGRRGRWVEVGALVAGLGFVLLPLVIRNHRVGAPWLATSNRAAEAFIQGHARTAHPYLFVVASDTRGLLERSGGHFGPLVIETLKTHPDLGSLLRFEAAKAASLFDPFESYDNLSPYYLETISPLVRWGLKHWMILVPGLAGLVWGLWRRDQRQAWLWLFLAVLLLNVLASMPLSRYRQVLALLWIPWAAVFLGAVVDEWRQRSRLAWGLALGLLIGWLLVLGPLARHPKARYERRAEYELAVQVFERLQQPARAEAARQALEAKFGPR